MRAKTAVASLCAVLVAGTLAATDRAKDEAAIRKVVEQVNTIHNRHEVEPLVALFDETVENWTGSIRGRAAYEKAIAGLFERERNRLQKELEEVGIVFVTDDVAIYKSRRQVTGEVDSAGNELPPQTVNLARTFVKREGRWFLAAWFAMPVD
jgi:ketosteroid isomerase-like protein